MRIVHIIALPFVLLTLVAAARAAGDSQADKKAANDAGPKLGDAVVEKWKFGISVTATGGPVVHLNGTVTVPMAWPEQSVKLVEKDLSPGVTIAARNHGTARQMAINISRINDGGEAHAIVVVEVTRHKLLPPEKTDDLVAPDPKSLPEDMKPYLSPSPLIESYHTRIRQIARELAEGQTKAWPHVRAIYDWVRKTIHYKEMKHVPGEKLDGCVAAIDKGTGDCNQLTSTFIAICRASRIPARTVRIPGHCYPEFYLEDAKGQGHWYPAEASGGDDFGGIDTTAPILQKGDNFKITGPAAASEPVRFLPETLTCSPKSRGRPALKLICEKAE